MKYSEVMTALEKEDRTPLAILWAVLIFLPFLILFPIVKEAIFSRGEENAQNVIAVFEVGFAVALIVSIIALVMALRYDLKASKQKKDERELLHEYQVSRVGYVAAIIGICLYAIPFQIVPAGSVFTGFEVPTLLLVILIFRLWKRIRLNRVN